MKKLIVRLCVIVACLFAFALTIAVLVWQAEKYTSSSVSSETGLISIIIYPLISVFLGGFCGFLIFERNTLYTVGMGIISVMILPIYKRWIGTPELYADLAFIVTSTFFLFILMGEIVRGERFRKNKPEFRSWAWQKRILRLTNIGLNLTIIAFVGMVIIGDNVDTIPKFLIIPPFFVLLILTERVIYKIFSKREAIVEDLSGLKKELGGDFSKAKQAINESIPKARDWFKAGFEDENSQKQNDDRNT